MREPEPDSYENACKQAIEALCVLSNHTDDGEKELTANQIKWLTLVHLSYYEAFGDDDSDSDGSGFRVDGAVY